MVAHSFNIGCVSTLPAGNLQDVLNTHNSCRARYGVPPLSWSGSIATSAQMYSENCAFEHSNTKGLGENLSLGYRDWAAAIKAWMEDEESLYDWNNPGFTHETGHLTQVVSHSPAGAAVWL